MGLPLLQPTNINDVHVVTSLRELAPELIVLAGYGQIVKQEFIDLAPMGCINLHGGKLPQYRGSSPMNWALINGETEFMQGVPRRRQELRGRQGEGIKRGRRDIQPVWVGEQMER